MSATIPDEMLRAANVSGEEAVRELAVLFYAQGRLSIGKASELTGMSIRDFMALLASRDVPLNYDVEDFRHDLETLRTLGRL